MIERIMLPTDGSPESDLATPIALQLAKAQNAEVLLVQVAKFPTPFVDGYGSEAYVSADLYDQVLQRVREDADSNLKLLQSEFEAAGIRASATRIDAVSAAFSLLAFESEHIPDLVVMASHGRTGLARFALGSIADRMVRIGTAPVLVVRASIDHELINSALVMLDGSGVAEEVLPMVESLALRPINRIKLFRAVADPDDRTAALTYLDGVRSRLRSSGLTIESQVDLGDAATLIERAAHDVDLVILCTHGRGGLNRFRHGSVAERVMHEAQKPVLMVRAGTPVTRGIARMGTHRYELVQTVGGMA